MASVRLIAEDEATGKVKALYEEIKAEHGIDFVPNLYRAMASNPEYLEANWHTPTSTRTSTPAHESAPISGEEKEGPFHGPSF